MKNTKSIGDIGESAIIAEFNYFNIQVYVPFGDNSQSDLIADFGGKLQKIQIKTTEFIKDCVMSFSISSRRYNVDYKYTPDEVDFYALYCVANRSCYLVPYNESIGYCLKLRLEKSKNNQIKGVRMADEYRFDSIFVR